jgi:hypothetical protein
MSAVATNGQIEVTYGPRRGTATTKIKEKENNQQLFRLCVFSHNSKNNLGFADEVYFFRCHSLFLAIFFHRRSYGRGQGRQLA